MSPLLDPAGRLSRREFLRGVALGAAGLTGVSILRCGDDGDGGSATAEPTPYASPGGNATLSAPNMAWTRIAPTGELPPARFQHTLVTDGSKLYLFGGQSGNAMNDLWVYDAGSNAWTRLDAAEGPAARYGHNAVWDASSSKLVVFGGKGTALYNDTLEYDPSANAWHDPLAGADPASLPGARYGAASCLDESGHLLITHGSNDADGLDDTWQFDLASPGWSDVSPPSGQERPSKRGLIDGSWDTRKQRLLVYGGSSIDGTLTDDLWGFSPEFDGWQQVARLPRPSPRSMYALVYNADKTAATLIGGKTADGAVPDTWFFSADGETWAEAAPQGEAPSARYGHDAVIMPDESIYLFGGTDDTTTFNDLWRLELTG